MERTGYVLAGGQSLRMGRDKALIEWRGMPLIRRVAGAVGEAAGRVKLVGDPERYAHLGFPVIADLHPGHGPLGGVEAALHDTDCDWNLVVACDMPELTAEILRSLLGTAARSDVELVMAAGPGGPEPLCAAWHRAAGGAVSQAIADGIRRMTDVLPRVRHLLLPVAGGFHFRNLNTPGDWADHAAR